MDIKQILLVQKAEPVCVYAMEVAARLARQSGAMIEGLCLYGEPEIDPADAFAFGPAAVGDVIDRRIEQLEGLTRPSLEAFERLVTAPGLSTGCSAGETDDWQHAAIQRARVADLVVASLPGSSSDYSRVVEALVFQGGTPCLVVPETGADHPRFERVALAWSGSRESKRALDDGLGFLERAKAVRVLIVEDAATHELGQAPGLARHLARHGVEAEVEHLKRPQRSTGDALIHACEDFGAQLLVTGAYSHSRAQERILGGVTRTLLAGAPIPTLMSH